MRLRWNQYVGVNLKHDLEKPHKTVVLYPLIIQRYTFRFECTQVLLNETTYST